MGEAVTVASLTGSGCAEGVFADSSALETVGAGSAGSTAGLSVDSGAPGLSLTGCGLTVGAVAFVARGSALATGFSGKGCTARATGFCGIGCEARANGLDAGLIVAGLRTGGALLIPSNSKTISFATAGLERFGCNRYATNPASTTPCSNTLARIARRRSGSPKLEFGTELFKGLP